MSYNSKPDAEHIVELGKQFERQFGAQKTLDDAQLDFITMSNRILAAKPKDGNVHKLRAGLGGLIVKLDAALLAVDPGLHVNPPSESEEDKEHASGKLEPWLSGAWRRSQQAGKTWKRLAKDVRSIGRAWFCVAPYHRLWATDEYFEMVERRKAAAEADDADATKAAEKDITAFKRDNFPIRMRYVNPRSTWAVLDADMPLPEVVEMVQMTGAEIKANYEKVPETINEKSDTKYKVFRWANWQWMADVLVEQDEGKILQKFEHGMGCNPYVLIEPETEILPENDKGWRWVGALFYVLDALEALDTIFTDMNTNLHNWTNSPISQSFDKDETPEDPKTGGRPPEVVLKPGTVVPIWNTEEFKEIPLPKLENQHILLLQEMKQHIQLALIRPLERGEAKSGTSQNMFVTQVQIAEREFDPFLDAFKDGAEEAGKRFFRSVISLNKNFPDRDADKVAVYDEMKKRNVIEVGPKDVRGWENAIQARMSRAIPVDEMLMVSKAQAKLSIGLAPETVYEQDLGFENPNSEIRKGFKHRLKEALFPLVVQQAQMYMGQITSQASPEELSEMTSTFTESSEDLQQFLTQQAQQIPELATLPIPGNINQSMANDRRTAVPMNPRGPEQQVLQ